VVPGKNLLVLIRLFGKLELLASIPGWLGASAEGKTVREHYSRFVGKRNYERVLGPMLSAVPSQTADEFPADMLFKKRERREDVMRSFTLQGGLQAAVEGVLRSDGIEARLGCGAQRLERSGAGWKATLDDGSTVEAGTVALAVPPGAAAALLEGVAPEAAAKAAGMKEAQVDTLAVVTAVGKSSLPYATFFIPLDDQFHSIVTRDVVPDPQRRAFTLHFRPGRSREERLARTCEVLGVSPGDLEVTAERSTVLPSPVLGHAQTVAELDRLLATERLAVTGNWFGGLAIEDCALRSRAEWQRIEGLDG
jgi:UDP-galactopyranose mutase